VLTRGGDQRAGEFMPRNSWATQAGSPSGKSQTEAEEEEPHPRIPAELYRQLVRIRRFEEHVLEKFQTGVIFYGTTHTYLGQEANAVGC